MKSPEEQLNAVRTLRAHFAEIEEKFGADVVEHVRKAYLTGVNDGAAATLAFGCAAQYVLYVEKVN